MNLPNQYSIAVVLRDVAQRHHRQFADVHDEDLNWPEWYAEYMIEKVNFVLKTNLNTIDLAYLLTLAYKRFRQEQYEEDKWADFFAAYLVKRSA